MYTRTNDQNKKEHLGQNLKRIREMLGITQANLADKMGEGWSQKRVSMFESKEAIEPDMLSMFADVLGVPKEGIENFTEDAVKSAIYYISNIYNTSNDTSTLHTLNPQSTFNASSKPTEYIIEIKQLYERLLASEKEKAEIWKGQNN